MPIEIESLQTSHSTMMLAESCPRKLEFRKFYNLNTASSESLPAGVGQALHAAVQNYYITKDLDEATWVLMNRFPYQYKESAMGGRSLYAAYAVLQQIVYSADVETLQLATMNVAGKQKPCVEICFQLNIINFSLSDEKHIPVTYVGYIDLVLWNALVNEFLVYDIKTHRKNVNDLTADYLFDEQCVPYGIVIQHLMQRPVETFQVNYLSCYIDALTPVVQPYSFMKTREDVQDWAKNYTKALHDIKLYYNQQWFPRKSRACRAWNRDCSYLEVCKQRNPDVIRQLLEDNAAPDRPPIKPDVIIDLDLSLMGKGEL